MRLLGLALFTLLVMGLIQFALLKDEETAELMTRLNDDRILHDLVSELPADACDMRAQATRHTFIVRESDTWTALAGSPGYQKAHFNLPKDVRVESGVLVLNLDAQLQTDGIARLRVAVNGARRGEVILTEGESRHTVRVNLLPADLTKSVLEVGLAAHGRFPKMSCQAAWDGGMVVRIEPTSRIELTTSEPLSSLEDRLRATGNPVQMIWPEDSSSTQLGRLLRFAADQRARGTRAEFQTAVDSCPAAVALSATDLDHADRIVARAAPVATESWPLEIAREGPLSQAKFFEYRTEWRFPYDLRTTPGAELPTRFDLEMKLLGLGATESWMLSVTLNGHAVFAERIEASTTDVLRHIDLPAELQGFSNMLEVQLINAEPQHSEACVAGVPVMAQLERGTMLHGGISAQDPMPAAFINALPETLDLQVSTELNAAEATASVKFLAEAFGENMRWQPVEAISPTSDGAAELIWRTGIVAAAERHLEVEDRAVWLVWPKLRDETTAPYGLVRVTSPEDIAHYPLMEGARIAAIVTLPAPAQDELAAGLALPEGPVSEEDAVEIMAPNGVPTPQVISPFDVLLEQPLEPGLPGEVTAGFAPIQVEDIQVTQMRPSPGQAPQAGSLPQDVLAQDDLEALLHAPDAVDAAPRVFGAPAQLSPGGTSMIRPSPQAMDAAPTQPLHPAFLPALPKGAALEPGLRPAATGSATGPASGAETVSVARSPRPARRPAQVTALAAARQSAGAPEPLRIDGSTIVTLTFQSRD